MRRSKSAWHTYHSRLKAFAEWWSYGLFLISEDHYRKFLAYLIDQRKLSQTSWNAYSQALRKFYEILSKCRKNPYLWLFCQFISCTVIRLGELRLLQVDDIILEEKRVRIRAEISKNRKLQYVAIPEAFMPEIENLQLHCYAPTDYVFSHDQESAIAPPNQTPHRRNSRAGTPMRSETDSVLLGELIYSSPWERNLLP